MNNILANDCSTSSFKTANLDAERDINSDIYLEWQALCLGSADNISCRLQKVIAGEYKNKPALTLSQKKVILWKAAELCRNLIYV